MEIMVACGGNARDKKMWSGTPSTLIEKFEAKGIRVSDFNMFSCISKFKFILIRLYSKLFYYEIFARAPFLFTRCAKSINSEIVSTGAKKILFVAENIEVDLPNVDSYIYIDALLEPRLQYAPYNNMKGKRGFNWFYNYYRTHDINSFTTARMVFTQNEWTKRFLIDNYAIDENKIFNIGFGVNLTPMINPKSYDDNLLLIVLRKGTEELKGLYLLLQAFRIAKKQVPTLQLAVVGTELEREEGVTYFFNQPRSVTVDLFKRCTLYTMPALGEPNGVTYLEALANKSPIVGLNRFAFPEFAGYGKYGFICENEDPDELASVIIDALSDKKRLARMGEAGQRFVMERYSWDIVVDKMIAEIFRNSASNE